MLGPYPLTVTWIRDDVLRLAMTTDDGSVRRGIVCSSAGDPWPVAYAYSKMLREVC